MNGFTKSPYYRRFRFFSWEIYISRVPLKRRHPNRNELRNASKIQRLQYMDYHCELCGRHIGLSCSLYRLLPIGVPDRNRFHNVRVICPECHQHVQRVGGYRPMLPQKGGEA